jgi:hypothetical protein
MIEVLVNQRLLATDSNRVMASCIRLTVSSSYSLWSSACQWIPKRGRTFTDGNEEDEGGDGIENVEPFTSGRQLPSESAQVVRTDRSDR